MIDFLGTGTVRKIKFNDKVCIQFHPNERERKTVQDMLKILNIITLRCDEFDCRVDTFTVGDWEDGVWSAEKSSAWSALKNNCCPGCGEESTDVVRGEVS